MTRQERAWRAFRASVEAGRPCLALLHAANSCTRAEFGAMVARARLAEGRRTAEDRAAARRAAWADSDEAAMWLSRVG